MVYNRLSSREKFSIRARREKEQAITKRIFESTRGTPEQQEKRKEMVRKRRKTQKINPAVIVRMHQEGLSNRTIAKDLGCSHTHVASILKSKLGLVYTIKNVT